MQLDSVFSTFVLDRIIRFHMNPDKHSLMRLWFKSTNKQPSKSPEWAWTGKLGCLFVLTHLFKSMLRLLSKSLSCHLAQHTRQLSVAGFCLIMDANSVPAVQLFVVYLSSQSTFIHVDFPNNY